MASTESATPTVADTAPGSTDDPARPDGDGGATVPPATTRATVSEAPVAIDEAGLLAAGAYTSDLLSLELAATTTESFRVSRAEPGMIEIVSLGSTPEEYRGVAFMVVDTLIRSDTRGRHLARLPATTDLGEFLEGGEGIEVLDRRRDSLGGRPAEVWRIGSADPCTDCSFDVLFNSAGFRNQWGHPPGYVQEIWSVDAPGSPIVVSVEGPANSFDDWNDTVWQHLLGGVEFGPPTGYSLQQPSGEFASGFGEYAIGRTEIEVVDDTRSTATVSDGRGLVVPSSDERRLLLSVAYPSERGGFGAEPVDGSFPLVIVAPALFDAAISLPAERQLASHGFVVVTVRFPESSFPGGAVFGVPQQPADVSFAIDQIEGGLLPAEIASVTDTERLGLVGHSGGATTGFGLLTSECCQEPRIDAVVAHAGTPFDFNSARLASRAPILHVVSDDDQQISVDAIRGFHDATEGPSTFVVMEGARHLEWLDPQSSQYDATFDLVLTFLDQHLRDGQADLSAVTDESLFVEIDER